MRATAVSKSLRCTIGATLRDDRSGERASCKPRCYKTPVQPGQRSSAGRARSILAVTDFFPWPPRNGGTLRTSVAVEALAESGDLDLFSLCDPREPAPVVPPDVRLRRVGTAEYPGFDSSGRWRLQWLLPHGRRGAPMEVAMRCVDDGPRRAFVAWLDEDPGAAERRTAPHPYDLVWFARATIFEWLGRPALGPTVVDLHDLESFKERRRSALMVSTTGDLGRRVRQAVAASQARVNARRWRVFEQSVADTADRILLASADDARRAALPRVTVLPNTFRRPARPVGKPQPSDPPTLLFPGTFDYGPNVDGAHWLVAEIGPRIRARRPGAAIRLAGRTWPGLHELHHPPEVVVRGEVPEMETELAGADVVVVPVRYASGTRLKILESFAHRIPVVSTPVGAEGLDVDDGVHLLIAKTAQDFADACARLVDDLGLRRRVVDAAQSRFLERYEAQMARDRIAGLVDEVTRPGSSMSGAAPEATRRGM